jgi:hypothetical protein
VASAVIYTPVANLTALAALTPTNGDYFELTDSTGAESSALITGVTVGLVGAPGLTFRLRYDAPPGIFTFLGYFANDSETRYLKLAGGTLTGQLRGDDSTSASTPGFAFDGDPNTGVGRPGADELALITGGTARVTIDSAGAVAVPGSLSQGGNAVVVTTDSRLSDQRVPTDGSVTNTKVAAAAAIDGTKISPNFGSQNVVTTGTSSAAALIPTGSSVPTNGTYLPAANAVAIATNSTERLRIDSSGRLGLGTSSVSNLFHLSGSSADLARFQGSSYSLYCYQDAGGLGWSTGTGFSGSGIYFGQLNNRIQLHLGGSEKVSLTSTGLGIGTTSASTPLHIGGATDKSIRVDSSNGNAAFVGIYQNEAQLTVNRDGATGTFTDTGKSAATIILDGANGGSAIRFATASANNTGPSERGRWDSNGRFLVGTSTSTDLNAPFQIQGQAYAAQFFFSSSSADGSYLALSKSRGSAGSPSGISSGDVQGGIVFKGYAGSGWSDGAYILAVTDGTPGTGDLPTRLTFSTCPDNSASPVERLRIANNGNMMLGGTTQRNSARFTIDANGANAPFSLYTPSTASYTNIFFENPNGVVGSIATNGSATAYNTSSDYRLKEDWQPMTGAVDRLQQLNPVNFAWKIDGSRVDGFIAHEAQAVVPECVTGIKDEVDAEGNPVYQGIDQSKLVPLLTAALQEALAEIESLKARLTAAGI